MTKSKLITIIVLVAVVLAGVGAMALLQFSSGTNTPPSTNNTTSSVDDSMTASSGFNTAVLQQPSYTSLDLGMITQGRLPVAPPVSAGKANPFQ